MPVTDAVSDPVGVVIEVIHQAEPGLDADVVSGVVTRVAPGRNVRRRLAQALVDRPGLLTDGRSPAPRVAGDMLIALRGAGAVTISAPVCAGCDKPLRTMQRRGQDWYCGVCGPALQECGSCGKLRKLTARDRQGRPRCTACPPDEDGDPIQLIGKVVASLDPDVATATVISAVHDVTSRQGQRRQLAWALADHPELLTGAGAHAPVPSVLRLIEALIEAGAHGIVRPPCPRCGRVITLSKTLDGVRVCRNCLAKSRVETCSRCGARREPATRDEHGRPLCPHCLITDPANQETCTDCGRRRPVSVRTPDGPLCPGCAPTVTMTCAICGRTAPGVVSNLTGQPWCRACRQRRVRCVGCGDVRPLRGGSLDEPLCGACARPDLTDAWYACPGCGEPSQTRSRRCARCALQRRLRELLAGSDGQILPQLQTLHDHLADHDRPDTVAAWLHKPTAPRVLHELAASGRPLTHATLDELPDADAKPLRHLRAMLVATGALPPRDEQLARLERWVTTTLAEVEDPNQCELLHRYVTWHLLHRLRRRNGTRHASHAQAVVVHQHVRAAISMLAWLTANDCDLATARQGDLETWLISGHASRRSETGHFIRWANRHKLTSLESPATRWDGPTGALDGEHPWAQARRLLHDETVNLDDRVAGLLVLLYAQTATAIAHLTTEHVRTDQDRVLLQLGDEPVVLPQPLDALMLQLIATRRGHATLGQRHTSQWLFPGGRPAQPISAARLAERLRRHGLPPGPARSTALFGLASELPAALLARLLGIHISVAVAWQRASSGDWTNYAAQYSRRTPVTREPLEPPRDPGQ